MSDITYSQTRFKNPMIIYEGYEYVRDNHLKMIASKNWKCTKYGQGGCSVRAIECGDYIEFNGMQHNHLPNVTVEKRKSNTDETFESLVTHQVKCPSSNDTSHVVSLVQNDTTMPLTLPISSSNY